MKVNFGKILPNEMKPDRLNKLIADIERALLRVPDKKEQDTFYLTGDNTIDGENTYTDTQTYTGGITVTTTDVTLTGVAINEAQAEVTAHATTCDIWSGSNYKELTGSAVTFTDFPDAPQAGAVRVVRSNGAHTLTDAGALEVQGNNDFVLEDGDIFVVRAKTTSTFQIVIFPIDGNPVTAVPTGVPVGTILDYGGTTLPADFLECDGAEVSRTTYATLYTAIGDTWGNGDGSTTFDLPDLSRRVTVGAGGSGTGTLGNTEGSTGGSETHTLTTAELASHSHTQQITSSAGTGFSGIQAPAGTNKASTGTPSSSSTGDGDAHNIMQPSAVVMKIIKYQ